MVDVSTPVADEVAALDAAVDRVLDASTTVSTDDELLEQLRGFERVRRRLEAAGHQRILEVERRGLAQERACRSTAGLLSELLRIAPSEARRRVKDATDLGVRVGMSGQTAGPVFAQLAALHVAGAISAEHVRVVTRLIDRLPDAVASADAEAVETTLAPLATEFHPTHLAVLARRIEAFLNPDGTYRDEAEQQRRRELRLTTRPDGTGRMEGWLTAECLALWQAVFDPLAAPAPSEDEPDSRTPAQRLHDALLTAGQILLRTGLLPDSGGAPAAVQVTMTVEQVLALARAEAEQAEAGRTKTGQTDAGQAGAGQTDARHAEAGQAAVSTGAATQLATRSGLGRSGNSPWQPGSGWLSGSGWRAGGSARAAACSRVVPTGHGGALTLEQACRLLAEADVIPVFLTDTGGIVAYGREHRLATKAQRRALAARDRGCSFPGCTAPAAWCEVHHIIAWRLDGRTDLDNLTLLCPFHHRIFEAKGWTVQIAGGVPWWTPPAWHDPSRTPRRNRAHHLDQLGIEQLRAQQAVLRYDHQPGPPGEPGQSN